MTATLEQQRQQYSKQLAAHTLRQWNAVRECSSVDRKDKQQPTPSERERTERENEHSSGESDSGKMTPKQRREGRKGPQAVDFAARVLPKDCPSEKPT